MVSIADPYRPRPYVLDQETAPAFWMVGTLWLPMATGVQTGNRLSFIEQVMPPGLGPPTHRHPWADEGFYVLEGTCAFNAEGKTIEAGPGTFVHLPRMAPHSFSVLSDEARVVNFYAPAGFELVVMSLATPTDDRRRPSIEEAPPPAALEQVRILSRLFGQEKVRALPFAGPSTDALMTTERPAWSLVEPHVSKAETAPVYRAFDLEWRLLASSTDTAGTYDLFELRCGPERGLALHRPGQDEALYVLEGDVALEADGERHVLRTGSFSYIPAGTNTAWRAGMAGARLLAFHLPGGFDAAILRYGGFETASGDDDKVRRFLDAAGAYHPEA